MKTRVHDLESDYYNLENNIYLTKTVSVVILGITKTIQCQYFAFQW